MGMRGWKSRRLSKARAQRRYLRRPVFNEALEGRVMLTGVTIITHGFQSGAGSGSWVDALADQIALQAGGSAAVSQFTMVVHRVLPSNVKYVAFSRDVGSPVWGSAQNTSGEAIIKIDWSDMDAGPVASVATSVVANLAADYLLAGPIEGHRIAELPIHLIGHSRGASLMTAFAQRLAEVGVWVDQFTSLDPHPVDGFGNDDLFNFGDAPMHLWDNVVFADNYWREDGANTDQPFDFDGESVPGAHPVHLNEAVLSQGGYLDLLLGGSASPQHSDVHLWYHGTVGSNGLFIDSDRSAVAGSDWYNSPHPPRDQSGFYYSRIHGGSRPADGVGMRFDGDAPREPTSTSGWVWPNVSLLTPNLSIQNGSWLTTEGSDLNFPYFFNAAQTNATLQFGTDSNGNPYDEGQEFVTATATALAGVDYPKQSFSWTASTSQSDRYPFAKISDGTHTRFYYLGRRLVVEASPPSVDTTPPTALLTAGNITTAGGTTHTFTVRYGDNVAIDVADLDSNDILVGNGQGYAAFATFIGVNQNTTGTPRTATYRISAPGGSWDATDNGVYTVTMQSHQVGDTSNNFVAAQTLGGFQVSIGGPPNPGGPEITVLHSGEAISDDQATPIDFGTVVQDELATPKTFTIRNDGDQNLAIGLVSVPDGFRVIAQPSNIAVGQTGDLDVVLNSSMAGPQSGILSFSTNDSDEIQFDFPVQGTVSSAVISDAYEPNDDINAATGIGTITNASLANLSLHTATDNDYFSFTAGATGNLTVGAIGGGPYPLSFRTYASNGSLLSSGVGGMTQFVTSGQSYFLSVVGSYGNTTNYGLTFSTKPIAVPVANISDVIAYEGDEGETRFNFTVTLSNTSPPYKWVDYEIIVDGVTEAAAAQEVDYRNITGRLYFSGSEESGVIPIPVKGDELLEGAEHFQVRLFNPQGLTVSRGVGLGTIVDDDSGPKVRFVDVWPTLRNASVGSTKVVFTRPVTGFDLADLTLTLDGGPNLLTSAQNLSSADGGRTWTFANLDDVTSSRGVYLLSLRPNADIVDSAANPLLFEPSDTSTTWTKTGRLMPSSFTLTDLGDLSGGEDFSEAYAINESGEVVGVSGAPGGRHAFIWSATEGMRALNTMGGVSSQAWDINDHGVVVGVMTDASDRKHALRWTGLVPEEIGSNWDYEARAINNLGHIVGNRIVATGPQAFLFTGIEPYHIEPYHFTLLKGTAFDVNDSDFGVGSWVGTANEERILTFTGAAPATDIGTFPGRVGSAAYGVNNRGWMVGMAPEGGTPSGFAWVYDGQAWNRIGQGGAAQAVNDEGWVVGNNDSGPFLAPVVKADVAIPIGYYNQLLDASGAGWTVDNMQDINESGQIVGWGTHNNIPHAILLTPEAIAPTASFEPIALDSGTGLLESINITFSEPVQGFEIGDIVLRRGGVSVPLSDLQTLTTSNDIDWTLGKLASATAVAGTYTITIDLPNCRIIDGLNHALASVTTRTFMSNPWLTASAGASYTFTGSIGARTLTISFGTATFNSDATTAVANLSVVVNAGATLQMNATQHLASLSLTGGTAALAAGNHIITDALAVSGDGMLDVRDGTVIIRGGNVGSWNGSSYTGVAGFIQSGRNGGDWNGRGMITTSASGNLTTLGAAKASDLFGGASGLFSGETVSGNDALMKFTYGGDANLDGKINVDDYGHIDSSIPIGLKGYFNGDFNYDGKINVDDYGIIDFNVGIQGSPLAGNAPTAGETAAALRAELSHTPAVVWSPDSLHDEKLIDSLFALAVPLT